MTSGSPDPYRGRRTGATRAVRRRRGPLALLPLAVAAWALLEIWLLIMLGHAAGGLTVFLVLAAGVVAGALVIRHAGRRAWQRLAAQARGTAEPGAQPTGGGVLTMLGGLLLMVPGLLSDVVGLACLFPPTARLMRRAAGRALERYTWPAGPAFRAAGEAHRRMRRPGDDERIVRGEVIRDEDEPGAERPDERGEGEGPQGPRRP
ncbi:FxsA family membrane protein [Streptomyces triticirhizae]|uniref:FxsA family protein n=1 Tax=Streptomyces triticirhizae TaxID=2483353 RepID=A0A3M2LRK2_9ACTN|nr:FxsA family membrane protein [Streptomyces triticirhizae]RMI40081.1 FxsA family protein [Streptomyces triticirhizae]